MRYLVLSDIHGNWEALAAVLADCREERIDSILVLGDLVGYGAGPNEVVDKIREISSYVIRGNHDRVAIAPAEAASFNAVARAAVDWTSEVLTRENSAYLEGLPGGPITVSRGVTICHGSPLDEDEYIVSLDSAAAVFAEVDSRVVFYGHTHLPMVFVSSDGEVRGAALEDGELTLALDGSSRYLINPGSVGQPRDRNPNAAYLIFDSELDQVAWRRCAYELEQAQRRILEAGLPQVLAYRLAAGI